MDGWVLGMMMRIDRAHWTALVTESPSRAKLSTSCEAVVDVAFKQVHRACLVDDVAMAGVQRHMGYGA